MIDCPRPDAAARVPSLAMALFFAAIAVTLAGLAVLVLPVNLWPFIVPPLALALACAAGSLWLAASLGQITYEIGSGEAGTLRIATRRKVTWVLLSAVEAVLPLDGAEHGTAVDRAGLASARRFVNRRRGHVAVRVAGEWLLLSPTDPVAFAAALGAACPHLS